MEHVNHRQQHGRVDDSSSDDEADEIEASPAAAAVGDVQDHRDPQSRPQGNLPPSSSATTAGEDEVTSSILDCPVCLQPSVHPVELPCGHIFCFLCIKGVATQGGQQPRCAICRSHIPTYVLTNPTLKDISQLYKDDKTCSGFKWYYESRSGGWWQYEERTMQELEKAFEAKQPSCQLLIAGHMYDIDFTQMIQFRVGNRNLFRRIKRDKSTTDKRGIAGIRLVHGVPLPPTVQPHANAGASISRSRRSPRNAIASTSTSGSSARTVGLNATSSVVQNAVPTSSTSPNDLASNPVMSPVDSQQSYDDSDEDSDVFVDSDDDDDDDEDEEDNDDDMDMGEEEQESETDEYNVDEELRDGARAPTSRSDRSTSSFNNQTPPPAASTASAATTGSSSTRGRTSKSGNRSTPPTSASTPSSSSSTSHSDHVNASPSPVSPTLRTSPSIRSPLPSIITNTCASTNSSNISTSIQIGPGLRITVDYTNPTGEEEIL